MSTIKEPYQQSVDEIAVSLKSDLKDGLSSTEARERLSTYGKNELKSEKPPPTWKKFLAQFKDVCLSDQEFRLKIYRNIVVLRRDQ